MKIYVLPLAKHFPATHPKAGTPTNFFLKIVQEEKLHTIRGNYELWKSRIDKINAGKAVLSIREWTGIPYRSPQRELAILRKVGLQKLEDPTNFAYATIEGEIFDWGTVAKNDGLSFEDFCDWFKIRQKEPMAIIHFTKFRYGTRHEHLYAGAV